jgi:hypothetical protein
MAREARAAEAHVVLLGVLALEAPACGPDRGRFEGGGDGTPVPGVCQRPGRQLDERLVVDRPGGRDHDVLGLVALRVEASDLLGRRLRDDLGAADDRPAQRMLAEHRLAEQVEHLLLGIVLVHRDFLEDHRPF